jgi:uncharacterized protein
MRAKVLALVILAVLAADVARAQPAQQPSMQQRSLLTVDGSGQARAKPDYARLTASVQSKATTLDESVRANQNQVAQANTLLQAMKEDGVEIEQSNFSLAEDRPPYPAAPAPSPSRQPVSYTAATSFSLKANQLDHLNIVVNKLASSGLFELRAVSFEVTDDRAPLDEARRKAVAEARHKADVLADAAGVRLDEIATISDTNATPRVFASAEMASARSLLVIPPGGLTFAASVTISWTISRR